MQMEAWPTAGFGQAVGDASMKLAPALNPPSTPATVWYTRALVRQPVPFAVLTWVVPEHEPPEAPNGLSEGSALGTAWRAPWRAASATVVVDQSTRNMSTVRASRKNRMGNTSANSTSAWPFFRFISTRSVGRSSP